MKVKPEILILVPSRNSIGGVSNYFQTIKPHYSERVRYFTRGVRNQYSISSHLIYPLIFFFDIIKYCLFLSCLNISLVQINTSFGFTGIIRDAIFINLGRLFRKKTIVFFRGVDDDVIDALSKHKTTSRLFIRSFLGVDEIWVLSKQLTVRLRSLGYNGTIRSETTIVDTRLLGDTKVETLLSRYDKNNQFNILFISRLERSKGIYEVIEAFRNFREKYHNATLSICGDGREKAGIIRYIGGDLNNSIFFNGFVEGAGKTEVFTNAHLFVLPSMKEGMPNVVLEAMAFGLPVITTAVGGISDFFEEPEMGFIIRDCSPSGIATLMALVLKDINLWERIAAYNFEYARKNFYAPIVASRIESYYNTVLEK